MIFLTMNDLYHPFFGKMSLQTLEVRVSPSTHACWLMLATSFDYGIEQFAQIQIAWAQCPT